MSNSRALSRMTTFFSGGPTDHKHPPRKARRAIKSRTQRGRRKGRK